MNDRCLTVFPFLSSLPPSLPPSLLTLRCQRMETSSSMPLTSTRLNRDLVKIFSAYFLPSRCTTKEEGGREGGKKGKKGRGR